MPGGVGGARASLASTRFDAAAGGNHGQSGQHAPCGRKPPADPTIGREVPEEIQDDFRTFDEQKCDRTQP